MWSVINVRYNLNVCYKPTASLKTKFVETYGVVGYGSSWRKEAVNQCLEFQ